MATGDTPVASVIWLHGLGADGHDFVPLVPELRIEPAYRYCGVPTQRVPSPTGSIVLFGPIRK